MKSWDAIRVELDGLVKVGHAVHSAVQPDT